MPSSFKIGMSIIFICTFLLLKHYKNYDSTKNNLDFVSYIEKTFYDIKFKIRGEKNLSGLVGALTADDKSIEIFGRWPFPRNIYEKSFKNLKKSGVKLISFDVFFTEKSRHLLDESTKDLEKIFLASNQKKNFFNEKIKELLKKNTPSDISLAQSILEFKNIVQGFFFVEKKTQMQNSAYNWNESFDRLQKSAIEFSDFPHQKTLKDYPNIIKHGAVTNIPILLEKVTKMGFANNQPDFDGMIRKSLLLQTIQGPTPSQFILVPSLALFTAAEYLNSEIIVHFDEIGINSLKLFPRKDGQILRNIPVSLDGQGKLLINHYGPFHKIPQISLQDAYFNRLPQKIPEILIYGGTATGTGDKKPSPFDENFDGLGHHITIVENILTQNFMNRPFFAPFLEITLLIFFGILFSYFLKYANALKAFLCVSAFLIAFYFLDIFFLFGKGYWYYAGMFYTQSIALYFGITVFKYFTEEREKKKIKLAFEHYLNEDVIEQLLEHPEQLKLGGEKKTLTVFFSDVRGFTTISENLPPEKLTAQLNEYFTPMTKIILNSKGMLDKYIGDAIMAVWGTPVFLEDHCDRALTSSLEMLQELEILKKKWAEKGLPILEVGMGLNTGEMVVGNMGSDQRFDYTVLGDAVNLGSRLEGMNKNYGTHIICSEFTKQNLKHPENFILRELDYIQVQGKLEPIRIYEVMGTQKENAKYLKDICQRYEEGLKCYREQKWDVAIQFFQDTINFRAGKDPPSAEFIKRCHRLKTQKIDAHWNGIWSFKSK
jgi:adenylate cyclase